MSFFRKSPVLKALVLQNTPQPRQLSTIKPVALSYASYESTRSPSDDDAPPLIISHGLLGSKSNWNSLCKVYHQKTQRKVVAVDARNHGDSPHTDDHTYEHLATDLKELLRQLNVTKSALLGHSMGGRAAMLLALKHPEVVEKLIVADISPFNTSDNIQKMPNLFNALLQVELPKNVSLSVARLEVDRQLRKFVSGDGMRAFLLTNLVQKVDGGYGWRVNIGGLLANFGEISEFPHPDNLRYDGPVLFVAGGASDYLQERDFPAILKLFPNAEFRSIEGAGHWLHSERPAEFLQHTLEFLNKRH